MNSIFGIEISHSFAPISVRERLVFNKSQTKEVLIELNKNFEEVFILSTCNRLSIYVLGEDYYPLLKFIDKYGNYRRYLSIFPNTEIAVRNIFSTTSGLESQAIGEHQITGQVREFSKIAKSQKTLGKYMSEMIRKSIFTSKRVRFETNIGKYSISLATIGFDIILNNFEDVSKLNYLVIGTGSMANLITTILDRVGANKIFVASHDRERANEMAKKWNSEPIDIENIYEALAISDVVVGGTQGEINLLHEESMKESKCPRAEIMIRQTKKKVFIDFGVPRNFNPELKKYPNILLYDLDDIKTISYDSLLKRYDEIPKARKIVNVEVENYLNWFKSRKISPIISYYLDNLDKNIAAELKWLLPKFGDIDENQLKLIDRFANRLKRRISKNSLKGLKSVSQDIYTPINPISTVKKVYGIEGDYFKVAKRKFIVGTRGSKLALTQTSEVIRGLKKYYSDCIFEIRVITTLGDQGNLDQVNAFTSTLQRALLRREIDFCVHSYKDVSTQIVNGLRLFSVLDREDVRDAFISKSGKSFLELDSGSIIGTSSKRRIAQLKLIRSDIEYKFINGNIDKRIQKLNDENYDALVLAASGLHRLKLQDIISNYFTTQEVLPAVGQGALVVETIDNNNELIEMVKFIQNHEVKLAVRIERQILLALGGGCNSPIACWVNIDKDKLEIKAFYSDDMFKFSKGVIKKGHIKEEKELIKSIVEELKKVEPNPQVVS